KGEVEEEQKQDREEAERVGALLCPPLDREVLPEDRPGRAEERAHVGVPRVTRPYRWRRGRASGGPPRSAWRGRSRARCGPPRGSPRGRRWPSRARGCA